MVIDEPLPCRFSPTKLPRRPFSVFPDLRDLCVLRARPPSLVRENNAKQIQLFLVPYGCTRIRIAEFPVLRS